MIKTIYLELGIWSAVEHAATRWGLSTSKTCERLIRRGLGTYIQDQIGAEATV